MRDTFYVRFTAVAHKRPRIFFQNASGRLQLTTHTLYIQRSWRGLTTLSRHTAVSRQEIELTRNSSGRARPRSSHLAEPLWTDPWPKELNWCARAVLHLNIIVQGKDTQNTYKTNHTLNAPTCVPDFKHNVLLSFRGSDIGMFYSYVIFARGWQFSYAKSSSTCPLLHIRTAFFNCLCLLWILCLLCVLSTQPPV